MGEELRAGGREESGRKTGGRRDGRRRKGRKRGRGGSKMKGINDREKERT
jgi:hypothetical protein